MEKFFEYTKTKREIQMKKYFGTFAALVVPFSATSISAQVEVENTGSRLEEVVVTAQKRAESVQDVPISMQAFTGEDLKNRGIDSAVDITKLAPNLNVSMFIQVNPSVSIRGVGTIDAFSNGTGAVGLYMDEATLSAAYLGSLGLFDIDRVEILRGPQNSLFGRNTTGGAVNYISQAPTIDGELDGFVQAIYGSDNRIELEAATDLQLSENVALRLAAKSYDRDGNFNNLADGGSEVGEKDIKSVRGTLLWEAAESTQVTVRGFYSEQNNGTTPYKFAGNRGVGGDPQLFSVVPGALPSGPALDREADFDTINGGFNAAGFQVDATDWEDVYVVTDDRHDIEALGFTLELEHEFNSMIFTSISSYTDTTTEFSLDFGGPGLAADSSQTYHTQDHENKAFSQELRLVSNTDAGVRWIGGLYYYTEDSTLTQAIGFGSFGLSFATPPPNPDLAPPGLPLPPGQPVGGGFGFLGLLGNPYDNQSNFTTAELENEVLSGYGQLEWDVVDDLTLTLGLRYTDDTKKMPSLVASTVSTAGLAADTFRSRDVLNNLVRAQNLGLCDLVAPGSPCVQDYSRPDLNFEEWGGKIGVDYHLNEDMLLYGSYSRGFRSGKFDIEFFRQPNVLGSFQDLDVETLDAYEVGIKTDLLDGRLQINGAAFLYSWNDQQFFDVDPLIGPLFLNVAESRLMGFEAEMRWVPADNWYVEVGIGVLDTEVIDDGEDPSNLVEVGHELSFSPKFSSNLLISKDFRFKNSSLNLTLDMQYKTKAKTGLRDATPIDEYDEFIQVNMRGSYTFGKSDQYEIFFAGENLNGIEYCGYKSNNFAFAGALFCVPNDPGPTFALGATVSF